MQSSSPPTKTRIAFDMCNFLISENLALKQRSDRGPSPCLCSADGTNFARGTMRLTRLYGRARLRRGGSNTDGFSVNKNLHAAVFGATRFGSVVGHRSAFAVTDDDYAYGVDFPFRREITGDALRPSLG